MREVIRSYNVMTKDTAKKTIECVKLEAAGAQKNIHVRKHRLSLIKFDELNLGLNQHGSSECARRILEDGKFAPGSVATGMATSARFWNFSSSRVFGS